MRFGYGMKRSQIGKELTFVLIMKRRARDLSSADFVLFQGGEEVH